MKIKNFATKIITVIIVFTVMTPFMAGSAFAATDVSITGDDEVSAGSRFTVNIEFSGDNLAAVDGQIGYDPEKLDYVSGAEDGGEGYVILKRDGGNGKVDFEVTFQAKKGGSTGLDVSSSEILDGNKNTIENCADTKVIHISGEAADNDENVVDEEGPLPQEAEYEKKQEVTKILLIVGGAVVLAAIIIIAVALRRKKAKTGRKGKK